MVKQKVLVLDLDETLIHSHHDGVVRQTVKPGTPPDFVLKVIIDRHPVRFFVHKRPHVDFFLDIVSCTECLCLFYFYWVNLQATCQSITSPLSCSKCLFSVNIFSLINLFCAKPFNFIKSATIFFRNVLAN